MRIPVGEILERRSAPPPLETISQNDTEQDQQHAEIPLPAAPELLPYSVRWSPERNRFVFISLSTFPVHI